MVPLHPYPYAAAVVLVGERKDSQTYVNSKKKGCAEVGFESFGTDLSDNASEEMVLEVGRSRSWVGATLAFWFQSAICITSRDDRLDRILSGAHSFRTGTPMCFSHLVLLLYLCHYKQCATSAYSGCRGLQCRPQGPWHPRPAASAQAHQRAPHPGCHQHREGCGWFPPSKHRLPGDEGQGAFVCAMHS